MLHLHVGGLRKSRSFYKRFTGKYFVWFMTIKQRNSYRPNIWSEIG